MPSYLVVGASRGIGLAFVKQLSAIPQNTVFAGVRNIESSLHLQPLLSRSNVQALKLDMTDSKSLEAAAEELARITNGKLDVLILNAGTTNSGKLFKDYTYDELVEEHRMFENNVLGPAFTIKAFLPLISQGEKKKIIALSSANVDPNFTLKVGLGMGVTYTATKAALNAYITKLSIQYRQDGIIFRTISPGMVDVGATQDPPATDPARYAPAIAKLKPLYPNFNGPLTPEESVDMILDVVDKSTMADSGTFVSHHDTSQLSCARPQNINQPPTHWTSLDSSNQLPIPSYLVVGASRGIGLAFAKQLSAIPQNTVFAGVRNIESSIHLQPLLSRPNVHAVKLDMTDSKSLEAAAEELARITNGKLDVLIINAGITNSGKLFKDYTYDELVEEHRMFENNVLGPVFTIKAFLPLIYQGEKKKIIAISSANVDPDFTLKIGSGMGVTYTATKAALNAYITRLSVQYRQDGIIFRAICPGMVDVGATQDPPVTDPARYAPAIAKLKPLYPNFNGPLTPEESADMVLDVIDKSTMVDSGTFVSHHGNKDWL